MRKKGFKRILTFITVFLMLCAFAAGCKPPTPQPGGGDDPPKTVFELDRTTLSIVGGFGQASQTLVLKMSDDIIETPVWVSSNSSIASIAPVQNNPLHGIVRGHNAGTATITVSAGEHSASCVVEVAQGEDPATLTITNSTISLFPGGTEQIVYDSNQAADRISFTSNNTAAATVSATGLVTAVSAGTATIKIEAGITGNMADGSVVVTVVAPQVSLNTSTLQMLTEQEVQLTATANGPAVIWDSTDEAVVTVSQDGIVTAVANGTANITARFGEAVATCEVTVKDSIYVIAWDEDVSDVFEIDEGESEQHAVIVTMYTSADLNNGELDLAGGTEVVDPVIVWTVAPGGVVSVDDGLIKAVSFGEAVVTAAYTDTDGDTVSVSRSFTVPNPYEDAIEISSFSALMSFLNAENTGVYGYLTGDINGGGVSVGSHSTELPRFNGILDGRGFRVYNFNSYGGYVFGGVASQGVIKKVWFDFDNTSGAERSFMHMFSGGTIEDCRIETNFIGGFPHKSLLATNSNASGGTIKNSIFIAKGTSQGTGNNALFFQAVAGANAPTITASFFRNQTTGGGFTTTNGLTNLTATTVLQASTYSAWDDEFIWNIVDGQIPNFIDNAATVSIVGGNQTFEIGDTATLTAAVNAGGVIWATNNAGVVTINADGEIEAVSNGTAVITATHNGNSKVSHSVTITVAAPVVLSFTETDVYVKGGDTFDLSELLDTNRDDIINSFTWSMSSNGGRLVNAGMGTFTVNANAASGSVVVTVTSDINGAIVTATITVSVVTLSLSSDSANLIPNGFTEVTALISHGDVAFDWDDVEDEFDIIDDIVQTGNVFAITTTSTADDELTATIIITSEYVPSLTATFTVIIDFSALPTLLLNHTEIFSDENTKGLDWKDTLQLAVTPSNAPQGYTILWESSDDAIVSVTSNGLIEILENTDAIVIIKATLLNSDGTVVTAGDDDVIAECIVTLTERDFSVTITTENTVGENGLVIVLGTPVQLGLISYGDFIFTGSDDLIATVTAEGLVTAVASGTMTVTVTSLVDDSLTDTITIIVLVVEITNKAEFTAQAGTFAVGSTFTLTATTPSTVEEAVWESSNSAIVSVVDGLVTGVTLGTATVTVSVTVVNVVDGENVETIVSDTFEVKVVDLYEGWVKISTAAQFNTFMTNAHAPGYAPGNRAVLLNDIDMGTHASASGGIFPITGTSWMPGDFGGTIDGNGYEVYNFRLAQSMFNNFTSGAILRNIMLTFTAGATGNIGIMFAGAATGTIENTLLDIYINNTTSPDYAAVICHAANGLRLTNTIILLEARNTLGQFRVVGQAASNITATRSYYHIKAGSAALNNITSHGVNSVTQANLQNPTHANWTSSAWTTFANGIWVFESGAFPYLNGARALSSVTIVGGNRTVNATETVQLSATVLPARIPAAQKLVTWHSDNELFATVTQDGLVSALKAGEGETVTITATSTHNPDIKGTITVTIAEETAVTFETPAKTDIEFDAVGPALNYVTLTANVNRGSLEFSIKDDDGTVSLSEEVISGLTGSVRVTGLKNGTATIVATSTQNDTKFAEIEISVLNSVALWLTEDTLENGTAVDTRYFKAGDEYDFGQYLGSNRDVVADGVTWTLIGAPSGVAIDANGVLTLAANVNAGTFTVRVTSNINGAYVDVSVTVISLTVAPITTDSTPEALTKTGMLTITPTISFGDVTYVVAIGGEDVIEVSASGVVTVLTATANDTDTAVVLVSSVLVPSLVREVHFVIDDNAPVAVSLNNTTLLDMILGDTATLIATVTNATDLTVSWESDNAAVTVVNGVVTIVDNIDDVVTITATANEDGTTFATCEITLVAQDFTVSIGEAPTSGFDGLIIAAGGTIDLTAKVHLRDTFVFSTDGDASIATVSATGTVTAIGSGEITVTLTSDRDPSKTATLKIIVLEIAIDAPAAGFSLEEDSITYLFELDVEPIVGGVVWSSSNVNVATIDAVTGEVTTVSAGTTVISATSDIVGFETTAKDEYTLTVTSAAEIATITLAGTTFGTAAMPLERAGRHLHIGTNFTMGATSTTGAAVSFTSSDPSIATVNATTGVVTATTTQGRTFIELRVGGADGAILYEVPVEVYDRGGATAVVTRANFLAITGSASYVIEQDIDLTRDDGGFYENLAGNLGSARVNGNGYRVSNLRFVSTSNHHSMFGEGSPTLENIHFFNMELDMSNGGFSGLFNQTHGSGTGGVFNCIFEGTFNSELHHNGVIMGTEHGGSQFAVRNTLMKITYTSTTSQSQLIFGRCSTAADDRSTNILVDSSVLGRTGTVGMFDQRTRAGAFLTPVQLSQASTFDDASWVDSWHIVDGQYPQLISVFN